MRPCSGKDAYLRGCTWGTGVVDEAGAKTLAASIQVIVAIPSHSLTVKRQALFGVTAFSMG